MILPSAGRETTVFLPLCVVSLFVMIACVVIGGTHALQTKFFLAVTLVCLVMFVMMIHGMYRLHMAYVMQIRDEQIRRK